MHIPTQSHGPHDARGVVVDAAAGLRARRRDLVGELRTVAYWQRLVQARTDLCVAGLLYASPAPAAPSPAPVGALRVADPAGPPGADDGDLARMAAPPLGLDLDRVLGDHASCESAGAHLDRLRETGLALAQRGRALREELGVVTVALHAHLAVDGAGAPTRATTEVESVATGAVTPHPA